MNEFNHGPGKGDKDRSPGWRRNYDEINWPVDLTKETFKRRGNKLIKTYGNNKSN